MTRVAVALLPLACIPVLLLLVARGPVDPGGGEKALVWVLPWTLGSVVFGVSSLVLWRRRLSGVASDGVVRRGGSGQRPRGRGDLGLSGSARRGETLLTAA